MILLRITWELRNILKTFEGELLVESLFIISPSNTVEPVYIEHSREIKKCSMFAGVQFIQVLSNWRSVEIETKSRVIRET